MPIQCKTRPKWCQSCMLCRKPGKNQCFQGIAIDPMCNFLCKKCQSFATFIFLQMLTNTILPSFWPKIWSEYHMYGQKVQAQKFCKSHHINFTYKSTCSNCDVAHYPSGNELPNSHFPHLCCTSNNAQWCVVSWSGTWLILMCVVHIICFKLWRLSAQTPVLWQYLLFNLDTTRHCHLLEP